MKKLLLLFFIVCSASAQTSFVSWNIQNFGDSKIGAEINFIAETIKQYDVVALQEIVAGPGGSKAVARLHEVLNRSGAKWEYTISDPTTSVGHGSERYAFLWKTSKVKKIGSAWLDTNYADLIDREPYLCTFEYREKRFTVVNFHAIPKAKQPETEIKYLQHLPGLYPKLNLVFAGDFNCPQSHSVFIPLQKLGYKSAFTKQKTTLKKACKTNDCLASEYDNIWYSIKKTKLIKAEAIHFYKYFKSLKSAKRVSDHIPVSIEFDLK